MEPVSLRGYARHRGVSLRAVQKAIASGRIRTTTEGKSDVTRPASIIIARAVRENYLARLAKLEYEERSGKPVDLREAQDSMTRLSDPMNCANHTDEVGVIGVQAALIATRMQAAEPVEPTQS